MEDALERRTFFITGASSGIGKATAMGLALHGARLWLACRSEKTALPVVEQIREISGNDDVHFLELDLADLDSVRACALRFVDHHETLHALINNAGVAGQHGQTRQGFEMHFGVNYLGHFLLTNLLLDALRRSGQGRIVNISSRVHFDTKELDFDSFTQPTRSYRGAAEYSASKLCNVLHAKELSRRLVGTGVTSYSLHPGVVASNLWRSLPWPIGATIRSFMKPTVEGAATPLHCAVSPEIALHSGRYYDDLKECEPSRLASNPKLGAELWRRSEKWTTEDAMAPTVSEGSYRVEHEEAAQHAMA